MTQDPSFALAGHVCATTFADLPASAIDATRRDILDTFGCMLGGSGSPGIDDLYAVADHWGGREESRVLLRGRKLPAPQAAMMNASMGHALDFDDTLDHGGSIHPGVSILGAALAAADMLGGVSGREFVLAVTLGMDVSCRIAIASTLDRGWHRTAAIGIFGATAAVGKMTGLNPEQMRHALGVAYSHAAGNRQCITDAALTKRMQAGQAASDAILSAVLAKRGFTGAHNIFNGKFGFFELYQPNGADPSLLLKDLGTAYRGEEVSFKPYPCGRPLHATIDAALALRAQLGITSADDVASLIIESDPAGYADQFEGGAHKRLPAQVVEAQFAVPFLVAAAMQHGTVGIGQVSNCDDPIVRALSSRIQGVSRSGKPKGWVGLTVTHRNNTTVTLEATDPLGSPHRPLTAAQCETKFRDCAANAIRPLDPAAVTAAIAAIGRLDALPDATAWFAAFA